MIKLSLFQEYKIGLSLKKISVVHKLTKENNHMTISRDGEKTADRILFLFMSKSLRKLWIEGDS